MDGEGGREGGKAYLRGVVEESTGGGGEHDLLHGLAFVGGVVLKWKGREGGREGGRKGSRWEGGNENIDNQSCRDATYTFLIPITT